MLLTISGLALLAALMFCVYRRRPAGSARRINPVLMRFASGTAYFAFMAVAGIAQTSDSVESGHRPGGEANLKLPDLSSVTFLGGTSGKSLLMWGLLICALGLLFGLLIYTQLKKLPVHQSMREISELIYETCKTYLITQGKFIFILWVFIAITIALYFGVLLHFELARVAIILFFSVVGILGSYGVAWFGIRVNTFANSRTAFASLGGRPYPLYSIP